VKRWVHSDDFHAELADRETYVAELERQVVGWTSVGWQDGTWWMDDLWVAPAFMRRRVGMTLVEAVVARGRKLGASAVQWEADPHATDFYEQLGARHVRDSEPTRWSEPLPVYELRL
jgi:GNAT superfamily N-acetyltransferase